MPPPLHTIASLNDQVQVQAWKMPRLPKAQFHLRSWHSDAKQAAVKKRKKDEEG
jgi:hypothetical protein